MPPGTSLRRSACLSTLALVGGLLVLAASPAPSTKPAPSPNPSPAAQSTSAGLGDAGASGLTTSDYKIETDETHWNFNTGEFTMPHRVKFFRPGTDATSDKAKGNSKQGTAILTGNVVVHDSGDAPEAGSEHAYHGNGPATLTCDELQIDSKAKLYTAIGHVHFKQGSRNGVADKGILDRGTGLLHLEGAVVLHDGDSSLSAKDVNYNLNTKDVDVTGAPLIIRQPVPTHAPSAATPAPKKKKKHFPF
ncbi:MAG TPA: LptA/OstA family protein [Candidatus Sulfotelmatobacter sp.]|nr:LptA/OstA family protein [Candidatus Sulfotelmatobacter sp.]